MDSLDSSYYQLSQQLSAFIKKYYLNQIIKGSLLGIAIITSFFLIATTSEYLLFLSSAFRLVILIALSIVFLSVLVYYIAIPSSKYFKLIQGELSYEKAAYIIGNHFPQVQDRLLNVLQLKRALSAKDNSLLTASIEQKIQSMQGVHFAHAINLSLNKKYLKYAIPPLVFLIGVLLFSPQVVTHGMHRILQVNQQFTPPAPYQFQIKNKKLLVNQYEDFTLQVTTTGNIIPEQIFIKIENNTYTMRKKGGNQFSYEFKKVAQSTTFKLHSGNIHSADFTLHITPEPIIEKFVAKLIYPQYLKKVPETKENMGDLTIPIGTKITWEFYTTSTNQIKLIRNQKSINAKRKGANEFHVTQVADQNFNYQILVLSENGNLGDSIAFSVKIIPDNYPNIQVAGIEDSLNQHYIYFTGDISDDYGLRELLFYYQLEGENNYHKTNITFQGATTHAQFSHYWDIKGLGVDDGSSIKYYFEIWDNDGYNGSKYTRTGLQEINLSSSREIDQLVDQKNETIKNELSNTISELKKLRTEIQDIKTELSQKSKMTWEDKEKIKNLLEQQKSLQSKMEHLETDFKENLSRKENDPISETIAQKQEQLKELFEETFSDEMKELFKQMEEMLEKLNSEKATEQLDQMDVKNEEVEEELDRMLALMKKLEFEQKMEESIQELKELAKKERDLSEQVETKNINEEDALKKQQKIEEKVEEIEAQLDKMKKIDDEVLKKEKQDFGMDELDHEKKMEEIKQQSQLSQEDLKNNKKKSAADKQKNAAEKMEEMAEQLQQMQEANEQEQLELDMQTIRQILENVVKLSFDQEDLMNRFKKVNQNDPNYVKMVQEQYKLNQDAVLIKDSLIALSKKSFQIKTFVTDEIRNMDNSMQESKANLEDRNIQMGVVQQQYSMTAMNNIALMLSEVIKSMQDQLANNKPNSMCKKPGQGGKSKMPNLSQMQKNLKQQMEQMQKMLEEKGSPGGKKSGAQQKGGQMSKELAKMAQKQAAIRRALQEFNEQQNKDGQKKYGDLDQLIKDMDEAEEDIVNRQITRQLLQRQEEIVTRLLEAENAEKEREEEQKRKSNTATDIEKQLPAEIEEYLKKKQAEIELYKTLPPNLKPYYREIVERYFKKLVILTD